MSQLRLLAARQKAVMRVGKRQQRKGRPATGAAAAMDPNPVVMLVVCLFAAVGAMIESRLQTEHRRKMILPQSSAQPVASLCDGTETGIKRIVPQRGFRIRPRPAKIIAGSGVSPPEENSN
jgi:hypothetical protein